MKPALPGFAFLSVSILLFLAPCPINAAALHWLEALPQGNQFNEVTFLDDDTAIAVGESGAVMVTHDGGATWSATALIVPGYSIYPGFNAIAAVDGTTAVVAGNTGFYRTTDEGQTWTPIPANSPNDVDFAGGVGIAASGAGILRSLDGGQSWSVVDPSTHFFRVDAVSSTVMVAVGRDFALSTDGGATWTTLPFPSDEDPRAISFIDALHGAAVSDFDNIYVTSDGGATWDVQATNQDPEGAVFTTDVEMLDVNTLYVTTSYFRRGQLLRSSDGGTTWEAFDTGRRVRSMTRSGSGDVLLAGDGGTVGRWTSAAGIQLLAGSTYMPTDDVGRCAFLDANHGILVASTVPGTSVAEIPSVALRTSDGGVTWDSTELANTHLTDVAITTDAAYATGSQLINGATNNVILKSVDGGASWAPMWSTPISGTSREIEAIAFSSPTHGVAVARGAFFRIDNSTVTLAQSTTLGMGLVDVSMANDAIGVAVGFGSSTLPYLLRTTDGGTSWAEISVSQPRRALTAVAFASPQVCLVGDLLGGMRRSTDGGLTWNEVFVDWSFSGAPSLGITAIAFSTPVHGLAVGGHHMAETLDGGETWTTMQTISQSASGVACFEPFRAVITGKGLEVLEYLNQTVPTLVSSFTASAEPFAATLRWAVRDGSTPARIQIDRRVGDVVRTVADNIPGASRSYLDKDLVPGTTYEYTLRFFDEDGSITSSPAATVTIPRATLELLPNQPNPFNPTTTIRFLVPERGHVRLSIYDVAGHRVATLIDDVRAAGMNSVQWNGTDGRGASVASGIYLARLESGKSSVTRKMLLVK